MKRDNINYLVVGFFVLGLFALLLAMLYQMTGRGGPSDHYTVFYENVSGIKFGTPVLYEGYPVGQVEALQPMPDAEGMQYQLTLSVVKDWPVPEDSVAKVVASGLLSAMTIEIEEGNSDTMLQPGDVLAGREAVNLFAVVNDVAAEFQQLSDESLRPLLNTLAENVDSVTEELIKLTRKDIRPLITDIKSKLDSSAILTQTDDLLATLNRSAEGLEKLLSQRNRQQVVHTLDNLYSASGNLDTLLVNIDQARAKMDTMLSSINELITESEDDLQTTVNQLRAASEAVAENIDSIAYHLKGTSRNMHEFSRYLRANPGALLRSPTPVDETDTGAEQ